jgi:hypothetical protein
LALAALAVPHATAQCSPHWVPGIGDPGATGPGTIADMTLWDPDGPGPLPVRLAVAGQFTSIGGVAAVNVAWMDLATGQWYPLGPGLAGATGMHADRLAARPNGELIAGGYFSNAGALTVGNIAAWNGSAWTRLGAGASNGASDAVSALLALPNGDVLVGGAFLSVGGVPAIRIARWNGSSWSNANLGSFGGPPTDFALAPNGDVIAVGEFRFVFNPASTVTANGVARWNGFAWSALGAGAVGSLASVTVAPGGDVYIGGAINSAGGIPALGVARWDGSGWSALGAGLTPTSPNEFGSANALLVLPDGGLIASGYFTRAGGAPASAIALWDGAAWSPLGAGLSGGSAYTVGTALALLPSGNLAVGGDFLAAGGLTARHIAEYALGGAAPTITAPPTDALSCPAGPVQLSGAAVGAGTIAYRWRIESPLGSGVMVDLADPGFSDPVSGLSFTVAGADSPSVSLSHIVLGTHPTTLRLTVRASNACGQTDSAPATLTVCPGDFNCDGFVDFFDYLDYTTCFQTGVCGPSSPDFNGDGFVDFFDYADFVDGFQTGC